mgnify:CR=1 FL=1
MPHKSPPQRLQLFDGLLARWPDNLPGLIGQGLPTHKTVYQLATGELKLADGQDSAELRMTAPGPEGVTVTKVVSASPRELVVSVDVADKTPTGNRDVTFAPSRDFKDGDGAPVIAA